MPRPQRDLKLGYSDRVTTRCNNREFRLTRHECRQVFLYALKKVLAKFQFSFTSYVLSSRTQLCHCERNNRKGWDCFARNDCKYFSLIQDIFGKNVIMAQDLTKVTIKGH